MNTRNWTLFRLKLFGSLAILVPVGFATKQIVWLDGWFQGYAGGVCYVVFWTWLWVLILPARSRGKIAWTILSITCALEFLQLLNLPWLDAIRSNTIGRTLFGNTFSWWDFPHYALGSVLALFGVRVLDSSGSGRMALRQKTLHL